VVNVRLFRPFSDDRRLSMEVYADGLAEALREGFKSRCRVEEYQPTPLRWPRADSLRMRLSRFGAYPIQARRAQGQINHILDHGYGHLLYALDVRRTVVTVHDLIPLLRWLGRIQGATLTRRPWLNLLSFRALRRAARLVADSHNTMRDLIAYARCDPHRIRVIHPGVDAIFRRFTAVEKANAREKLGVPADGKRRVLLVGGQVYKNHKVALAALAKVIGLAGDAIEIVRIGGMTPEWTLTLRESGLENAVRDLGVVPRTDLAGLYNTVDMLFFPSAYEGFGWPPLEAMACGTPVVASNAASLPEVIGKAAVACRPDDCEGLARAVQTVLTGEALRSSLIESGLARVREFSWKEAASRMCALYEELAAEAVVQG